MADAAPCHTDPANSDDWHRRGLQAVECGNDRDAFEAFRAALRLTPDRADSYVCLGELLLRAGQADEALVCLHRAAVCDPGSKAATRLGEELEKLGDAARAVGAFRMAVERDREDAHAWFGLGRSLESAGQAREARSCYEYVLRILPGNAPALDRILDLVRGDDCTWATRAEAALNHPQCSDEAAALIGYGLAKHLDRRGAVAEAAIAGRRANAARRHVAGPLDRTALAARIDAIIATFHADFFGARRRWGLGNDQPVFIVGLPRSGTTLVEQVLAAHPQMHGAGELPDLARLALAHRARPEDEAWRGVAALDRPASLTAAHDYLTALQRGASGTPLRISDKSPLNFFLLAFAALLFPNARVVHCTRDPRDTALSVWMENFSTDQQWSTDFDDLAFFAGQYRRLMAHWREHLPLPILEVAYEDTVADVAEQSRRLLEFLDVPWDDRCLDFHNSGRAVQTPSRWQVRQPIYTRSVGRWQRYAEHLPELEPAFAALTS